MDQLHIGQPDDENYEPYGKLSDGTPVFIYRPPPPPDPQILREERQRKKNLITNYNKSTEIKSSDTSKFLQTFHKETQKEIIREEYIERVKKNKVKTIAPKAQPDTFNVLDYVKPYKSESVVDTEEKDTDSYLQMFQLQEERDKEEADKLVLLQEEKQRRIEEKDSQKAESAKQYQEYIDRAEDYERQQLSDLNVLIDKREEELLVEYSTLLKSEPKRAFYTERSEYDIKTHIETRGVTVTNKGTGDKRVFNYIGNLESAKVVGYKLRLYSIVKSDKEYGVVKESYNYMTHRYTVYDLRSGEQIKRETFIISKLDPQSISSDDPDVYYEGTTSYNQKLTDNIVWEFTKPGNIVISLSSTDSELPHTGFTDVDPYPMIGEMVIELYGAGGSGSDGRYGEEAHGGGGGAYIKKTFYTQDLVGITGINVNVGDGLYAGVSSTQTDWDNQVIKPSKDTYVVVGAVTAAAGGGRDAIGGTDGSYTGAFQGQPMYTYDTGFYGMGIQAERYLSAANAFTEADRILMQWVSTDGRGGRGAALSGHGSSTNNVGASGGRGGTASVSATPGDFPGAGGGGGGNILTEGDEGGEGVPSTVNIGASGGNGWATVTITRLVVNSL